MRLRRSDISTRSGSVSMKRLGPHARMPPGDEAQGARFSVEGLLGLQFGVCSDGDGVDGGVCYAVIARSNRQSLLGLVGVHNGEWGF